MVSYKNCRKMQHFHGNACGEKVSCPLMSFLNGTHLYPGKARKGQWLAHVWQCIDSNMSHAKKRTKTTAFFQPQTGWTCRNQQTSKSKNPIRKTGDMGPMSKKKHIYMQLQISIGNQKCYLKNHHHATFAPQQVQMFPHSAGKPTPKTHPKGFTTEPAKQIRCSFERGVK